MTNHEIYKIYKHGESFKHTSLSAKRIFTALKSSGLQVILVRNREERELIYNYIPETSEFHLVFKG